MKRLVVEYFLEISQMFKKGGQSTHYTPLSIIFFLISWRLSLGAFSQTRPRPADKFLRGVFTKTMSIHSKNSESLSLNYESLVDIRFENNSNCVILKTLKWYILLLYLVSDIKVRVEGLKLNHLTTIHS